MGKPNKNGTTFSNVTYWPSTEPSIKRCTCVNKRKNSGSRWAWYNYITRCGSSELESVGDKMPAWEPAADRGLWALSNPQLSNPAKMRKKCCYGQKNLGQYVAVCPRLQLTSHTQPTSTLSRIKCERYIFIKKCVRSFIEVRHYCWLCFRLYLYVCYGYTTQRARDGKDFSFLHPNNPSFSILLGPTPGPFKNFCKPMWESLI